MAFHHMFHGDGASGAIALQPISSISASEGRILSIPGAETGGAMAVLGRGRKDERIPQWGFHETKDFIAIRAEFERDFTQTKRNKVLWELIAERMREKGFRRSADQCKCKWKNLVNRYKGKEISEPDNGRQCPFYDELDAIFKERSKNMDRLLLESSDDILTRPKKQHVSDEETDEEDEDECEDSENEQKQQVQQIQHQKQQTPTQQRANKKRKTLDKDRQRTTAEKCRASSMQEVLEDFFQQQHKIEEQWRVGMERRESERRAREEEWKVCMEKLERERVMREQAWWDREEQRRLREEHRSRRRDELVEAILRKLIQED